MVNRFQLLIILGRNMECRFRIFFLFKSLNIFLSFMDLPLVISITLDKEGKKQQNYYPIEVLKVCDNQRVKTNQLTSNMTQLTIKVIFLLL